MDRCTGRGNVTIPTFSSIIPARGETQYPSQNEVVGRRFERPIHPQGRGMRKRFISPTVLFSVRGSERRSVGELTFNRAPGLRTYPAQGAFAILFRHHQLGWRLEREHNFARRLTAPRACAAFAPPPRAGCIGSGATSPVGRAGARRARLRAAAARPPAHGDRRPLASRWARASAARATGALRRRPTQRVAARPAAHQQDAGAHHPEGRDQLLHLAQRQPEGREREQRRKDPEVHRPAAIKPVRMAPSVTTTIPAASASPASSPRYSLIPAPCSASARG